LGALDRPDENPLKELIDFDNSLKPTGWLFGCSSRKNKHGKREKDHDGDEMDLDEQDEDQEESFAERWNRNQFDDSESGDEDSTSPNKTFTPTQSSNEPQVDMDPQESLDPKHGLASESEGSDDEEDVSHYRPLLLSHE
jgi:hypothetical protein